MEVPNTTISLVLGSPSDIDADLIVVGVGSNREITGAAASVDELTGGALRSAIEDGAFKGNTYETEWIYPAPGLKARRVLIIGTGKADAYDRRVYRQVVGAAVRIARRKGSGRIVLALNPPGGLGSGLAAESAADAAVCALSGSDLYKDKPRQNQVEGVRVWVETPDAALEQALVRGQAIGQAVNFARWLGDEPSNVMTPLRVAEEARKMAEANGIECEVLEESQLREMGMGSLLAVSAGSQYPPCVVVLTYRGAGDASFTGLVGKGVTFDTGGISIKPAQDMHYMKYDMCGAADVISAVQALAQMRAPVNVLAVAGLVENMPGGRATRPGDVVRAANGKTIEIINTDAEGRLVLADALDLAIKRGAEKLVDVATLTGAIKVALGDLATGLFARPDNWANALLAAAETAGERLWRMPVYPEYKDNLKSNIADLMNTGARAGGACNAAVFIEQFVGDKPWAHLDVAGTAWLEKDFPWQGKGATGAMVRTLIALAESQSP